MSQIGGIFVWGAVENLVRIGRDFDSSFSPSCMLHGWRGESDVERDMLFQNGTDYALAKSSHSSQKPD